MRCEWKKVKISDVCKICYGKDHKQLLDGNVPAYGSGGIIRRVNKSIHEKKSVLIPRKGSLDNLFFVDPPFWTVDTLFWTDIDETKINPAFFFYQLKTLDLASKNVGTAVPSLTTSVLNDIEINLPSMDIQKQIAAILSALDEKIAINREINENLERQISEIYRVWYQKYVCAVGLPLVESEYGLIPQGWHYSLVGELCKSISISHKFDAEKLIFLNTGDIEDGRFLHANYMAVSDMPGQAKKTILPGDILYSEIRPINKHYAYVTFPSEDYVVSTKLMVIRASGIDSRRLYHYLTTEDVITKLQMEAESRSGTFPQIRFDNISKLPILIADDVTEAAFTTLLHTVYDQIEYNNSENEKLASLRDSLLPRLISGEIDVSAV